MQQRQQSQHPPDQPDQKLGTNSGGYFFIREHNRVFEKMGVLRITGFSVATDSGGTREWMQGGWASPGLTDVFGVQPVIGRWFRDDDTQMGIVISHGFRFVARSDRPEARNAVK